MEQRRSGQRKSRIEIASLARAHTNTVINMLVGIVTRDDASPTARIAAGLALLDRGWASRCRRSSSTTIGRGILGKSSSRSSTRRSLTIRPCCHRSAQRTATILLAPEPSETEPVPETPQP